MSAPFTYAAGDLVRLNGERHAVTVVRINLNDTVDVRDTNGLRTVWSGRIGPSKPGDTPPRAASVAPGSHKAGKQ